MVCCGLCILGFPTTDTLLLHYTVSSVRTLEKNAKGWGGYVLLDTDGGEQYEGILEQGEAVWPEECLQDQACEYSLSLEAQL